MPIVKLLYEDKSKSVLLSANSLLQLKEKSKSQVLQYEIKMK